MSETYKSIEPFVSMSMILLMSFSCVHKEVNHDVAAKNSGWIKPNHPYIKYSGRIDFSDSLAPAFDLTGTTISLNFNGTEIDVLFENHSPDKSDGFGNPVSNWFTVVIDDMEPFPLQVVNQKKHYVLAHHLLPGNHEVKLFKRTEPAAGMVRFLGFKKVEKILPPKYDEKYIEFVGNSVTCGAGNNAPDEEAPGSNFYEDGYMSYAAIAARNMDAKPVIVAWSGKGVLLNADSTNDETLPALYKRTLLTNSNSTWNFKGYVPEKVIINLGTNDFWASRPHGPDSALFVEAYSSFIGQVHHHYPEAAIICVTGPMKVPSWKKLQRYVQTAVEKMEEEGDGNIFYFPLSMQDGAYGYGHFNHPTIAQHVYNAQELTLFMKSMINVDGKKKKSK